jgi:hypothetical protein
MGLMGEWPDKVAPLLIEPRLLDLRETELPYDFSTAAQLLSQCSAHELRISSTA